MTILHVTAKAIPKAIGSFGVHRCFNSCFQSRKFAAMAGLIRDKAYINGKWVSAASGKVFAVTNPTNGNVLANVPDMDESDTKAAIAVAHSAFQTWKQTTGKERSLLMRKLYNLMMAKKDELAELITLENGKPIKESVGEIIYSADYLEFYAEESKRIHGEILNSPVPSKEYMLVREPIGVAGMLTPWNFPMAMIARKVAAALAAGCTCVMKPAEDTPLSTLALAALAEEAGFPPGVVNVVTSNRGNAPNIGLELCTNPNVAGISFTGSTAVGKILYKQCASTVKRLAMELGGNAPFIVFESANLELAVANVMTSKFRNSGQTCVSTNRILVHENIYEQFLSKLEQAMKTLVVGDGLKSDSSQGPLINETQFKKVGTMVQDGVSKGAKVITGGTPHSLGKTFYSPTLLKDITPAMDCYKEEIFGPVAMTMKFKTEEEALKIANDTRMGLASYFFSNDLSQIRRVSKGLQYGMVGINEGIISAPESAFGGIKESGFGREGSHHGLEEYMQTKYLCFGNLS